MIRFSTAMCGYVTLGNLYTRKPHCIQQLQIAQCVVSTLLCVTSRMPLMFHGNKVQVCSLGMDSWSILGICMLQITDAVVHVQQISPMTHYAKSCLQLGCIAVTVAVYPHLKNQH